MTDHRQIVARGFRVGGWLLGVPSALGLAAIGASLVFLRTPENKSDYLDIGKYGIAGLLANGAKGLSDFLGGLGHIAFWMEEVLAAGLAAVVALAAILYFTGRGIARHARGANVVGLMLSIFFALFWLGVLLSTSRSAMAVPAAGMAMAGYSIWVLGWR